MSMEIRVFSELLKGERIAIAAYRAIESSFAQDRMSAALMRIERDHERTLELIENQTAELWEDPVDSGEVWRAWADAIEAGAHHLPSRQALDGLQRGEERQIEGLEKALDDDALSFDLRELIGAKLLPRARAHVTTLRRLRQRP